MKGVLSGVLLFYSILLISCDNSGSKTSSADERHEIEYFYPCNNSYKYLTLKREINPNAVNQNYWNGTILLRNYSNVLSDGFIHIELRLSSEAKVFLVDDQNGVWRIYSSVKKFHITFNGVAKPLDRIDFWVEGKSSNRFPQVHSLIINEEELCFQPTKWSPTISINSYNDVNNIPDNENWPWFASVLRITNQNTRIFVCGGSIINERTIITAASCFFGFDDPKITVDQFIIEVGKFNRNYKYRDQTTVEYEIESIVQHPEYEPYTYEHYNVALIILNLPIQYNKFTEPITICDQQCYATNLNRRNERVIGWGPEIKRNRLEANSITIIPYDVCILTNRQFYTAYLDHQSFCAGNTTGTRICSGFGGSGLVVRVHSVWYLQAIVSIAPPNLNVDTNTECYLQNFVIFTDLIHFGTWINTNKYQ